MGTDENECDDYNDDGDDVNDLENQMLIERNQAHFKKLIDTGEIDAVIKFILLSMFPTFMLFVGF